MGEILSKSRLYSDSKKQITEMGATMTIVGGEPQGRMSTESDFVFSSLIILSSFN